MATDLTTNFTFIALKIIPIIVYEFLTDGESRYLNKINTIIYGRVCPKQGQTLAKIKNYLQEHIFIFLI